MADLKMKNISSSNYLVKDPVDWLIGPQQSAWLSKQVRGDLLSSVKADLVAELNGGRAEYYDEANAAITTQQALEDKIDECALSDDDAYLADMKADALAKCTLIQFNHRPEVDGAIQGGSAGGAGAEVWLMFTDGAGNPVKAAGDHTMTVSSDKSGKVDGSASNPVVISKGIGKFQASDAVAETAEYSITGTPPNHTEFGSALPYSDKIKVKFD